MKVDLILTTYNRRATLARTLASLFEHTDFTHVGRIVISDDGSTDGTALVLDEFLRDWNDDEIEVEILPQQNERLGLIPRFNMAYAMTTAPLVCNVQDDVEFYPGWLDDQLKALEIAEGAFRVERGRQRIDFVTGYDAPEHHQLDTCAGYAVKHSAGFVQLLARRETWDRWFPMTPTRDFPTPTVHEGRSIGSGIDTSIYGGIKNSPHGKVNYLVVPGLKHTAQQHGSTWRPDIQNGKPSRFNQPAPGGLSAQQAPAYWRERFQREGGRAVGFANRPAAEQTAIIDQKQYFLRAMLDTSLRTIEYGCGTGLFSDLFDPEKYVGYDITEGFLEIARRRNPSARFVRVNSAIGTRDLYATGLNPSDFEQFMTINVLQHNDDIVVSEILRHLTQWRPGGFRFALYENIHAAASKGHMRFRSVDDYLTLIGQHFRIRDSHHAVHEVHGERHAFIQVEV